MVTKSFDIFNDDKPELLKKGGGLILEVGKSHVALLFTASGNVAGFELYTFPENEATYEKLFTAIGNTSALLNGSFDRVNVFVNHELCLPVPKAKYSASAADDFLTTVFGLDEKAARHDDPIAVNAEIVNLYRVSTDLETILQTRFGNFTMQHSWSNVIEMLDRKGLFSSMQLMHVQFYNTYFIIAVIKDRKLHLIQSFSYESHEDVLYYLLNIAAQFNLATTEVEVSISGLIDPNYKLFRELTNYFKNITADKFEESNTLINVNEYPRHYFTPFFNLAL